MVGVIRLSIGRLSRGSSSVTGGEAVRRLGRWVLWLFVLVLLVRGLTGIVGSRPVPPVRVERLVPAAWPDDEARAFGAAFARAYFTVSPRDPSGPVA